MGDQKRAAVYYKKYQSTNAASTPDGKFDATPYLLLLGNIRPYWIIVVILRK